jgi:hypothetical protein
VTGGQTREGPRQRAGAAPCGREDAPGPAAAPAPPLPAGGGAALPGDLPRPEVNPLIRESGAVGLRLLSNPWEKQNNEHTARDHQTA